MTVGIALRTTSRQVPTVRAIGATMADFKLKRFSSYFNRAPQRVDRSRKVIGMHRVVGGPIPHFFNCLAEIFRRLAVDKFELACRTHGRHKSRNTVDDQTQVLLISAESLLRALQVVDIGVGSIPIHDIAGLVSQWLVTKQEPAILSIKTPQTSFNFSTLPRCDVGAPPSFNPVQVLGVNSTSPTPTPSILKRQSGVVVPAPVPELS